MIRCCTASSFDAAALLDLLRDELPRHTICRIGHLRRPRVYLLSCLIVPGGLEQLDQVPRRDDRGPEAADEFDGARIDFGDVRIAVPGEYSIATLTLRPRRFEPLTPVPAI